MIEICDDSVLAEETIPNRLTVGSGSDRISAECASGSRARFVDPEPGEWCRPQWPWGRRVRYSFVRQDQRVSPPAMTVE